ncbi:hypothetical protein GWK47_035367 [Chionoecetes opilio]|uniref:Uncharacterized protein n=1 Tax=Chionoecetes opilio TaxID=41210 RepID=A0A8J4YGY0_CHIOP|nr:hypothetical protein GWK47_035367 [Chionoecetes opilio]
MGPVFIMQGVGPIPLAAEATGLERGVLSGRAHRGVPHDCHAESWAFGEREEEKRWCDGGPDFVPRQENPQSAVPPSVAARDMRRLSPLRGGRTRSRTAPQFNLFTVSTGPTPLPSHTVGGPPGRAREKMG